MHGTIRIMLELDGERILNAEVEVGLPPSGLRKNLRDTDLVQPADLHRPAELRLAAINNVGYALAVEKLSAWTRRSGPRSSASS